MNITSQALAWNSFNVKNNIGIITIMNLVWSQEDINFFKKLTFYSLELQIEFSKNKENRQK